MTEWKLTASQLVPLLVEHALSSTVRLSERERAGVRSGAKLKAKVGMRVGMGVAVHVAVGSEGITSFVSGQQADADAPVVRLCAIDVRRSA